MGVNRLPGGHDKALGRQRLQTDIIGTAGNGSLDAGGQQLLEGREQDVLQVDGQSQQAIEERGDRRQVIPDAARVRQLQSGRILERLKRAIR